MEMTDGVKDAMDIQLRLAMTLNREASWEVTQDE